MTNLLFWVQENKLSEKFYKKIGFDVVKSDDSHSKVQLGDFAIVLVNMRDEDEFSNDSMSGNKGRGMYVQIETDDVDETYKSLLSRGIEVATKPRDWPWDNREFIVKDPDGYKLCFWQKLQNLLIMRLRGATARSVYNDTLLTLCRADAERKSLRPELPLWCRN